MVMLFLMSGMLQRLEVFNLVKFRLMKQEPESSVSIRAVLIQPSNCEDEQLLESNAVAAQF